MATEISGDTILTIGTTPELITFADARIKNGVLFNQPETDAGTVAMGETSSITTSTAPPIPKGEYGYCSPHKITADGVKGKTKYLVASEAGQKVHVRVQ